MIIRVFPCSLEKRGSDVAGVLINSELSRKRKIPPPLHGDVGEFAVAECVRALLANRKSLKLKQIT